MKRNRYTYILAAIMLIGAIAVAFVLWIIGQAVYWQGIVGSPIEKELGFTHGSPYVRSGDRKFEVFTFEQVAPSGIFGRAGIRNGYIPVSVAGETHLGSTKFYRLLEASRGQTVEIKIVPGGDGDEIASRPVQSVTFEMPEK